MTTAHSGTLMKALVNIFIKGLLFTLPIAATFGLLFWMFSFAESLLKGPLQLLLPDSWYVPGIGVLSILLIIFSVGLLAEAYLVKYLFTFVEFLLGKIPIVKTLYGSARNSLQFIAGEKGGDLRKVVAVSPMEGVHLIGFVTDEGVTIGEQENLLAVYLPFSYQIGGYLVYLPRDKCEVLDIPVKEAMQNILTANLGSPRSRTPRT